MEVKYSDVFGERHSDIFYVDPIKAGIMPVRGVSRLAAEQAIKLHREGSFIGLSIKLSQATPEVLLNKSEIMQQISGEYPLLKFLIR